MDVLSSRILLRPSDLGRSRRFYRHILGLAIYREFGHPDDPGVVFFLGLGLLEVSGYTAGPRARNRALGLDRNVDPGPDGIQIVLVPADHPLRRDPRSASPPR